MTSLKKSKNFIISYNDKNCKNIIKYIFIKFKLIKIFNVDTKIDYPEFN